MNRNLKNSGKLLLSFLLILAMIIPSMNIQTNAATMNFTDVPANAWYKSSVQYCFDHGYMSGTNKEKTLFSPTANLNRGMMVSILWNIAGKPAAKKTTNFTDIKGTTAYYYKAVQWAAENKVVSGFADGSFGPSKNITREQLASMLRNFAKYRGQDAARTTSLSAFKDASKISSYAKDSVAWAVAYKIISGKSGGTMVDPKGNATRAEAAAMIKSYCDNVEGVKTSGDGKVLNIMIWNDEFARRMADYTSFKPFNAKEPALGGTIGDITVNFQMYESFDNVYTNHLKDALKNQSKVSADKRVDLFLMEDMYMTGLIEGNEILDINTLLTKNDTKDMYPYTKDICTNSKGVLKAVSWQICPSVMYYNKNIASEVFGMSNTDDMNRLFATWEDFNKNAMKVKAAGYLMTGTYQDTLRTYVQNGNGWVKDGKLVIDVNVKKWLKDSKNLFDNGLTTVQSLWDSYNVGFCEGNVFCGFGPQWLYQWCFDYGGYWTSAANPVNNQALGVCVGPQSAVWGGSYIGVASQTDNKGVITEILKALTCDQKNMEKLAKETGDVPNNMAVVQKLANDPAAMDDMMRDMLDGMNPYAIYHAAAMNINGKNRTDYDETAMGELLNAACEYIVGAMSEDEIYSYFRKSMKVHYPELF